VDAASAAQQLRGVLDKARNADGGWGYQRGHGSRLEPTALALLALSGVGAHPSSDVLLKWPRAGGLLADPQSGEVNLTHNGQAAVTAQALGLEDLAARLAAGLIAVKGQRLPPADTTRQDNSLQGWPWVVDTFSWVEPTAWCLIALKRWARIRPTLDVAARIEEADRLLIDRACREGGWNYGNSVVLGQVLAPYVSTTALTLIALRSRRDHAVVTRSLGWLRDSRLDERSGLALSLTLVALSLYGEAAEGVEAALDEIWRRGEFLGNLMTTALALYAFGAGDRYDALAI